MAWFKEDKVVDKRVKIPEGTWIKCDACGEIIYRKEVERNFMVCPKCTYHFRISARERIALLFDEFEETHAELSAGDPMGFVDALPYPERVRGQQAKTGLKDALISGNGRIGERWVKAAILEFGFMGGSMGSVVGQKIVETVEEAISERRPFISVSSSGGARMQEGIYSLMQMAKTSAAVARLSEARLPYLSILTDPTFGGVTVSFAMLGDVNIAEPRSLIGFAGPRVIEQTIKQKLPEGFQRAEFLLDHGTIDMVVDRKSLKSTVAGLLDLLA